MKNKYLVVLWGAFLLSLFVASRVSAHCDTLDGPVIADARLALEKQDITLVLKWIKKGSEPELRAAFELALTERKLKPETADTRFFEALVRIHRAGEGASFEGLKPAGSLEPIIAEADQALESGSVNALNTAMSEHLVSAVSVKFERAREAKKHKDESVEAGRAYVEAYVEYIHYVERVHEAVLGAGSGHQEEVEAAPAHAH